MTVAETGIDTIIAPSKRAVKREALLFAENSPNGDKQNVSDSTESGELEQKNKTKTQKQVPTSKSKTAPLTSFEPSEKVKADQAVDFPYDI